MRRSVHDLFWLRFLLLGVLVAGCVEPIDLGSNPNTGGQLVVEGWVNDVDDIHVVTLRTSTANGVGTNTLGLNAQVSLITGGGRTIQLIENLPGIYETSPGELVGRTGDTYQLMVTLANGEQYESTRVTLPESVGLGNTFDEFIENRGTTDNGTPFVTYSHDLFVQLENTEQLHYVKLESTGWARRRIDYGFEAAGPLECWEFINPIDRAVVLTNNTGIVGDFYPWRLVNIPVDFRGNFIAEIYADAMSLEAFAYWEQARVQLARGGGVFDPPFAPVVGNISNVNRPEEIVLGYFHAYARTMTRYCYSRLGVPGQFDIPRITVPTLCTDVYAPAAFELPFEGICP